MTRKIFLPLVILLLIPQGRADEAKKPETAASYQVPYRLTETKHVMIRARINGKGPFNFILDTGAPALYVATGVCRKLGVEADKDGWGTFERFEIEGGVPVDGIKGKVADPFQLESMNKMGLAGVELHGVIGYNLLARYRLELDFTRDKMTWTRLKFDPALPEGLGAKGAGGMDAMAGLVKLMAGFLGNKGDREPKPRGFLGVELIDTDEGVRVKTVLADSPADKVKLQANDRITRVNKHAVKTAADIGRRLAEKPEDATVTLTCVRGDQTIEFSVTLGKGF